MREDGPLELTRGTVVERYTVEGVLGHGGMAVVYRVVHNQLGSTHAMKVLSMPTASVRKRLMREGRVQSALRHPNVVAVTDVVDLDGIPALVMEYVRGPSLADFLGACRPTREQADALAVGILAGVQAAHAQGLVHRDLKPGNVLLSTDGGTPVPKITDFGLAKVLDDAEAHALATGSHARTRTGVAMGTPAYMAPEQIRDSSTVDHRADLWSMGAILYELATGERAFRGDDTLELFQAVCAAEFVPVKDRVPSVPQRMVAAIEAALTVPLAERVADCATLTKLWTGSGKDTWSSARGIWDQQTLFQVEAISQSESNESAVRMEREANSEDGTFLLTTRQDDADRGIEAIGDAALEVRTVAAGPAVLESEGAGGTERTVQVTRAFRAAIEPVSMQVLTAAGLEEPGDAEDLAAPLVNRSWDGAIALCNALSEVAGLAPAYTLGEWRLRRDYHLDEIGRMLYDRMHFDRIAGVLAAFGTDTLRVLQFEPERLEEVDGIGPKTAARVGAEWDRTLAWTRDVTWDGEAPGWRLPTEAEAARLIAALGAGAPKVGLWTWDGDEGPRWSDVASPLVDLEDDRRVDAGNRRVVRGPGTRRRALEPLARPDDVGLSVVRTL